MRKVLKKTLVIFLIIITLFNYTVVQADAGDTIENLLGTFVGIITWIFRLPPIGIAYVMNMLTAQLAYMDNPADGVNIDSGAKAGVGDLVSSGTNTITPYEIFFNQVRLFDVNFFDLNLPESSSVYKIRMQVAKWFYVMRLVAISILLVVLIYVGIRMAITTIADDKARYKHMLVDWVTSLALVFVLHFIIIIVVNINNALVGAIAAAGGGVDEVKKAIDDILGVALGVSAKALGATVVYCMIVWQTFGFVLSYLNRTIKIAFLIIISPLISITYSIDKMGDGKSQAVNNWLKEFIYSILMQPFHAIIYMTMVSMALELLAGSGGGLPECILAILCIKFVKTAEDLVRSIFDFKDDNKDTSLSAGTAAAAVALNKSKDIGKTARKGVNLFKESKITDSIKNKTTKVRAAARALKESSEDKKAREETGAKKPSFATRMKQEEAKIEQERIDKKEAKANKKAWDKYQKYKDKYTDSDKKEIVRKAHQFRKENPNMSRKDALNKARIAVSRQKIESGAYKNKTIQGMKRVAKAVSNSETAKYIKNTVIPVGFGMGIGFMAFGGDDDAFEAGMKGIAAGKSVGEFMTSSTSTLANGITEQLRGKGTPIENAEEEIMNIKLNGDGGNYDDDAKKKQKEAMEATMGYSNATDVRREVDQKFKNGEYEFDVSELVRDMLKSSNMSEEQIKAAIEATNNYKNFQHDSAIYSSIGNAENVGIPVENLAKKVEENLDLELTEDKFVNSAKQNVLTKETVKIFKNRNNYDLEQIKSKLTNEIRKVDEQIERLKEQKLTMGTDKQIKAANKNISKLEDSKDMLEENVKMFEDFEAEFEKGTF